MAADKKWDDDDGRVIADMSDLARPGVFSRKNTRTQEMPSDRESAVEKRPWETEDELSLKERTMYALGALKAALLIALVFIIGLGVVIAVMLAVWS